MESEQTKKPKYSGYGYHGGGRKPTGRLKQFANTTISGTPEEIAEVIYRIAGLPSYVTGQIITADGGWI